MLSQHPVSLPRLSTEPRLNVEILSIILRFRSKQLLNQMTTKTEELVYLYTKSIVVVGRVSPRKQGVTAPADMLGGYK